MDLRIENGATSFVEVTITVANEEPVQTSIEAQPAPASGSTTTGGRGVLTGESTQPDSSIPEEIAAASTSDAENDDEAADLAGGITIGLREPSVADENTGESAKAIDARAKVTVSQETVRLAPATYSEGVVVCGEEITVSARITGNETSSVVLSGAGAGTIGFDSGSVGLNGERLLFRRAHYLCGDTVIIRVTDDGTSAGSGGTGTGEIEIYGGGETPPPPALGMASTVSSGADSLELRIDNQTGSFAQLHLVLGPPTGPVTPVTATGESSDGGFDIRVAPGFLSTGVAACESQVIMVGSIVTPGVQVNEQDSFTQVVLGGLGTGTMSFDENSVGTVAQQRILIEGIHYECGDVIQVQFTDDGNPTGAVPTVGQGTVSLLN